MVIDIGMCKGKSSESKDGNGSGHEKGIHDAEVQDKSDKLPNPLD